MRSFMLFIYVNSHIEMMLFIYFSKFFKYKIMYVFLKLDVDQNMVGVYVRPISFFMKPFILF